MEESRKSTLNRRAFLIQAAAISGAAFVGGDVFAQQNSGQLSPEQLDFVQRNIGYGWRREMYPKDITNLDPILVSKYLIFTEDWLNIIGNNKSKQVTREQFKNWTNALDNLYECYKEFMGKSPEFNGGNAVNIGNISTKNGVAGRNRIQVNVARSDSRFSPAEIRRGNPTFTMLHEMGHVFSYVYTDARVGASVPWAGNRETAAELLVMYALEKGGFNTTGQAGIQHRYNTINRALNNLKEGKIKGFGYHEGTAYDLYMFGLVDRVGWDTIKKTVQSYDKNNSTYIPAKLYEGDMPNANAHQFFDRIAFFHDQARELGKTDPMILAGIPQAGRNLTGEQVLKSLPDKGKYLDEHFTVPTTPLPESNTPIIEYVDTAPVIPAELPTLPHPVQETVSVVPAVPATPVTIPPSDVVPAAVAPASPIWVVILLAAVGGIVVGSVGWLLKDIVQEIRRTSQ